MADDFEFLQTWFLAHCDGDWEHDTRIEISSLDNPGWYLTIVLDSTELEGGGLDYSVFRDNEPTWLHCWSDGRKFEAAAGPLGLTYAIEQFRLFASGEPMQGRRRVESTASSESNDRTPAIHYGR